MKLFNKLLKLLKEFNIIIISESTSIITYGNYGGAGYSAGHSYDSTNGRLYFINERQQPLFLKTMSESEYMNTFIEQLKECEPIDELDACFKLHDIDTKNTRDIMYIIKISHHCALNMTKCDAIFYIAYPLLVLIGVIYSLIVRKSKGADKQSSIDILSEEQWAELKLARKYYTKLYSDKYAINYH